MRKILKNKNKSERMHGAPKGKIGVMLNIVDKNNILLSVGDHVKYGNYRGVLLYNYHCGQYGIALDESMWYGDNLYDINSYGKFVEIPLDNGAKMELEKLDEYS